MDANVEKDRSRLPDHQVDSLINLSALPDIHMTSPACINGVGVVTSCFRYAAPVTGGGWGDYLRWLQGEIGVIATIVISEFLVMPVVIIGTGQRYWILRGEMFEAYVRDIDDIQIDHDTFDFGGHQLIAFLTR
ncbi:uncharacterized protein B0T23DRAFT_398438 [Neurospora hispaniola]|uniref:Uncharacterized protein n=1 Tax=Neurospora hispaniola TaxID=588809 RepID=A0AAJ0I259_9PEZI|nr:hypothetical protein B0T23DRAFT_398438 [Neurospora hispaniola]